MNLFQHPFRLLTDVTVRSLHGPHDPVTGTVRTAPGAARPLRGPVGHVLKKVHWFAGYLDLEKRAETIKMSEANPIPGLVQTEDYARAVIATGLSDDKDALLAQRMARQKILGRPDAPYLFTPISQNALERPIGSPKVMRDQLTRLLELSEGPKVVIRVVPRSWDVGAYLGLNGSFQLIAAEDYGEVAYAAAPNGGRLVKAPGEVRSYSIWFDQISAKALPEAASQEPLRQIRKTFHDQPHLAKVQLQRIDRA